MDNSQWFLIFWIELQENAFAFRLQKIISLLCFSTRYPPSKVHLKNLKYTAMLKIICKVSGGSME